MAERHAVRREAPLQGAVQRARRVLDEMREAIVGTARAMPSRRSVSVSVSVSTAAARCAAPFIAAPARAATLVTTAARLIASTTRARATIAASRDRPRAWPSPQRPPCSGGRPCNDGGVELVDHFGARHPRRRQRLEVRRVVAIDHHAVRHRAQVAALAADEHEAEMLVRDARSGGGPARRSAPP